MTSSAQRWGQTHRNHAMSLISGRHQPATAAREGDLAPASSLNSLSSLHKTGNVKVSGARQATQSWQTRGTGGTLHFQGIQIQHNGGLLAFSDTVRGAAGLKSPDAMSTRVRACYFSLRLQFLISSGGMATPSLHTYIARWL